MIFRSRITKQSSRVIEQKACRRSPAYSMSLMRTSVISTAVLLPCSRTIVVVLLLSRSFVCINELGCEAAFCATVLRKTAERTSRHGIAEAAIAHHPSEPRSSGRIGANAIATGTAAAHSPGPAVARGKLREQALN